MLAKVSVKSLDVKGEVPKSPGWVVAESWVGSLCLCHHDYLLNREPLVRWQCFCSSREQRSAFTNGPLLLFQSFILGAHATLRRRARLIICICLHFENYLCSKLISLWTKGERKQKVGITSLRYEVIISVDHKNEKCKKVIRDRSLLCCGLEGGGGWDFGSYEIERPKVFCRHWETRVKLEGRG